MPIRLGPAIRVSTAAWWLLAVLFATPQLAAQATSRVETINGLDGWPIRLTYYPAPEKSGSQVIDVKQAAVVVLLHGEGGDRSFWDKRSAPPGAMGKPFAEVLQSQGYAVISVDLRKHGESAREGNDKIVAADYEAMVADLAAIKEFIFTQHQAQQLNMRKLAIVALDNSVPVAVTFAERDWALPPFDDHALESERTPRGQDVRAIVMLSPVTNVGRIQASGGLRSLGAPARGMSFFVGVGKKDAAGLKAANTLFKLVGSKANEDRTQFEQFDTNERSEHLFGNARIRVEVPVLVFLKKQVQDLSIPWVDRRSRTDRD